MAWDVPETLEQDAEGEKKQPKESGQKKEKV
jgi:hypothetical protein